MRTPKKKKKRHVFTLKKVKIWYYRKTIKELLRMLNQQWIDLSSKAFESFKHVVNGLISIS